MVTKPLFDAITTRLQSLEEHLIGGVYRVSEVGQIHYSSTPEAYDTNRELMPCLLVNDHETVTPSGGAIEARRVFLSLIFYEILGTDLIASLAAVAYTLLHDWSPEDVDGWPMRWSFDVPSLEGPNNNAPTIRTITSRYVAYLKE